jgi:hypothetical protein
VFIEAHLPKSQYIKIQSEAIMKNCNIYPSYHVIKVTEEECYPSKDKALIQESLLEVDLQALTDKTATIIIMAQKNATDIVQDNISKEFILILKWGCNETIGYSKYKPHSLEDASDSDIFITSVVPFQLHSTKTSGDKITHWQNPRPSSVKYCHPIQIQFKKETAQLAKEETSC